MSSWLHCSQAASLAPTSVLIGGLLIATCCQEHFCFYKNHLKRRKLEDKMIQMRMELRPFHLNISLKSLHGNCEQPSCYTAWLAVLDCTLPTKGVQYRMVRPGHTKDNESPSKVPKDQINVLLSFDTMKIYEGKNEF